MIFIYIKEIADVNSITITKVIKRLKDIYKLTLNDHIENIDYIPDVIILNNDIYIIAQNINKLYCMIEILNTYNLFISLLKFLS